MLYLLDANVFITAKNTYYPIDRVPEFWEWLIHQGEQGNVKIVQEVYDEIHGGDDDLSLWAKEDEVVNALILDEAVDVDLVRVVTEQGYAADLTDDEVEKLGRDPFLIAYALVDIENRTVVTTEVSSTRKQRANRRVPDVCNDFDVECIDTFKLTSELIFSTNWKTRV